MKPTATNNPTFAAACTNARPFRPLLLSTITNTNGQTFEVYLMQNARGMGRHDFRVQALGGWTFPAGEGRESFQDCRTMARAMKVAADAALCDVYDTEAEVMR